MYDYLWPITAAISIIGIVGNLISIWVWKKLRKNIRRSETGCITYFILLPVVDTLILILHITTESLNMALPSIQKIYSYTFFYCYIGHPLYFFFIYTSGFLVVSLTIQRAQVILSPMKKLKMNVKLQTKVFIFLAFLVSFLLNITSFFAFVPELIETNVASNNTTVSSFNNSHTSSSSYWQIGKNPMEHKDIMFIVRCVFATGVPSILIFIGNFAICKKQRSTSKQQLLVKHRTIVRRASSFRTTNQAHAQSTPDLHQQQHQQQSTTLDTNSRSMYKTLLMITCSTFFFWSVRCINGCMQYIIHTDDVINNPHVAFQNLAVTIGASINLLIYYLPGKSFRKQLRRCFTGKNHLMRNGSSFGSLARGHSFRVLVHQSSSAQSSPILSRSTPLLSVGVDGSSRRGSHCSNTPSTATLKNSPSNITIGTPDKMNKTLLPPTN